MRELTKEEFAVQCRMWNYLDELGIARHFCVKNKTFQVLKPIVSKQPKYDMFFILGTLGIIEADVSSIWPFLKWYELSSHGTKHVRRDLSYAQAKDIASKMTSIRLLFKMNNHNPFEELVFMSESLERTVAQCTISVAHCNRLKTLIDYSIVSKDHVMMLLVKQSNRYLDMLNIPGVTKIVDPRYHGIVLCNDAEYHKNKILKRKKEATYVKGNF